MPESFFEIDQEPKRWAKASGKGPTVVMQDPWRHPFFLIGDLRITGRAAWNAGEPVWRNKVVYYNTDLHPLQYLLKAIVIHHTNNSESIKDDESAHIARGFAAIGYHFVIDKTGVVFEGRPLGVMGSHAGEGVTIGAQTDPDWGAIGIALQGDYHHADDWVFSNKAPDQQLQALEHLVKVLMRAYTIQHLLMHREVSRKGPATVCPGDHLVPKIKALRAKLKLGT